MLMIAEQLITDFPGWPKEFQQHEKTAAEFIRQIFTERGEPLQSFDQLLQLVDTISSKIEQEILENTHKSPVLILARLIGGRNIKLDVAQELLSSLKKAKQTLSIITRSLEESAIVHDQIDNDPQVYKTIVNEKYKLRQAVCNQMVSQLLYTTLEDENINRSNSILAIFLAILTNYKHWLAESKNYNLLQGLISGARAQSGIAHSLKAANGVNIFPDYKNKNEVLEWDVQSNADFLCYIDGKIVIIDCKGKQFNNNKKNPEEPRHPYQSVRVDRVEAIEQSRTDTVEEQQRVLKFRKTQEKIIHDTQRVLNLKHIKTPQINATTGENIVKLVVTVPTHPSMMNHLGKLKPELQKALVQEIRKAISS